MGMSASQARLLALTERMNDIEYQGQQINQQRTTLSNQINALYNTLLAMDVPTPPSTNDYQKVVYSGNVGATKYNFEAGDVIPKADNKYQIKIGQVGHGNTISAAQGYSVVDNSGSGTKFLGVEMTADSPKWQSSGQIKIDWPIDEKASTSILEALYNHGGTIFVPNGDGGYDMVDIKAGDTNYVTKTVDAAGNVKYDQKGEYYIQDSDGTKTYASGKYVKDITNVYVFENDGVRRAQTSDFLEGSDGKYMRPNVKYFFRTDNQGDASGIQINGAKSTTVNGREVYTFDQLAAAGFEEGTISKYKEAIANSNLQKSDSDGAGKAYTYEDFYVIVDKEGKVSFALITDVDDGNKNCVTYNYEPNGDYETKSSYDDCLLEFDPSNGRISSLSIPVYGDDGAIVSYTTIRLEAKTEQDEAAYQDAMADYNYNKALYDKQQEEINKKTEIIQQEDKNLELKLTRLDNERNAVNTEIEAVKKVIQDAIDKGFKTFSG